MSERCLGAGWAFGRCMWRDGCEGGRLVKDENVGSGSIGSNAFGQSADGDSKILLGLFWKHECTGPSSYSATSSVLGHLPAGDFGGLGC